MNVAIARSVRSSTGAPFSRTGMTTSGLTVWSSSRRRILPTRRWRTTLIEPVVDPAEPADEHQREDRQQRDERPQREVLGRVPRRRDDGDRLEDPGPNRLLALRRCRSPRSGSSARSTPPARSRVEPELLVADEHPRPPADDTAVEEHEVHARDEHEERDDPLRGGGERLDRVRAASRTRPSASSRTRARPPRTPSSARRCRSSRALASASAEHDGEPDVEHPQEPRRLPYPLGELRDLGARQLGLHQLAPADAEARQHRDREDDDPHPAEPLGELAPHRRAIGRARRSR